jgi:DNA-binding MarR family transcriptional regulator
MRTVGRIAAALQTVSRRCEDDNLGCITVFLCVCEHNGICIKDIVRRSGLNATKVSRSVENLRRSGTPGLVDVMRHAVDGRRRLVFLTEDGVRLRDEVERVFEHTTHF